MSIKTVFIRKEKKFLLNQFQKEQVLDFLSNKMTEDDYHVSNIYNIYFDTEFSKLIQQSLEQPDYKYKVRLRSYGQNPADDYLFFEIKSKLKGVVYKRRVKLTLDEYYNYLDGQAINQNNQVSREIDYLFNKLDLRPKMFIAYDRRSFKSKTDDDLRITFDENLRSRTNDLDIKNTGSAEKFFKEPTTIMEIKSKDGIPLWLTNFLSENQIYTTSFSKYGQIFEYNQKRNLTYAK